MKDQAAASLRESEERYRALVESSPACIHEIDLHGRFITMNAHGLTMMNAASSADVEGIPYLDIVAPVDRERVRRVLQDAAAGTAGACEFVGLPPEERTYSTSVAPVRNAEGQITKLIGVSNDLTEHRQSERALRESAELSSVAFQTVPALLMITAMRTSELIEINEPFAKAMGYSREELMGRNMADFDFWSSDESRGYVLKRLADGESIKDVPLQFRARSGEIRDALLAANAISFGGQPCIIWQASDLTERNRIERELHEKRRMESIGRLAGGVAHDFNNLLTVILGFTEEVLERTSDRSRDHSDLSEVRAAANQARLLVGQLLAFSRKGPSDRVELGLNSVIEELNEMLRRVIGEHVAIETSLDPAIGWIRADPGQIEQVIVNLAANARDAMPAGGTLRIETRGARNGELVRLIVSDSGTGIDAETREHMFEPFFTTKPHGEGSGLGLATVLGIVEQNGGEIRVDSEVGEGTRVTIELPAVVPKATSVAAEPPLVADAPGRRRTILVAEDQKTILEMAKRALEKSGYEVLGARDGVAALQLAEKHDATIDLLVTDVLMPRMGGIELARKIRDLNPSAGIILASGYADLEFSSEEEMPEGAVSLQKPFSIKALKKAARELLEP